MRLGILGSTRGSNLIAIATAIEDKSLCASVEVVISNKPDAGILQKAIQYGFNAQHICPKDLSREDFDQKVHAKLLEHQVDLIVLIGYMRILSPPFVNAWRKRILNVHPSLLPAYAGMMDMDVHTAVLAGKEKYSGCTVHFVTEELDAGPIVVQKKCEVALTDTPENLKQRVQSLEGMALIEAIKLFI